MLKLKATEAQNKIYNEKSRSIYWLQNSHLVRYVLQVQQDFTHMLVYIIRAMVSGEFRPGAYGQMSRLSKIIKEAVICILLLCPIFKQNTNLKM